MSGGVPAECVPSDRDATSVRAWLRRPGMTLLIALIALFGAVAWPGGTGTARAASLGDYSDRLAFSVDRIDPISVIAEADPRGYVTISGSYTNTGADPIGDLAFRFQRGDALTTTAALKKELADPQQPVAVVGQSFRALPGTVEPGASVPFAITVAAFDLPGENPDSGSGSGSGESSDTDSGTGAADTLGITAPGVYPVMVNMNGTVRTAAGDTPARVGELHVVVTVHSVPADIATGPGSPGGQEPGGEEPGDTVTNGGGDAQQVSVVWPLVDRPHIGLGGVFTDDTLATEISPGGRLHTALQSVAELDSSGADPSLVTLLVDPMLLDELDRMSRGYRVLAPGTIPGPLRPGPMADVENLPASAASTSVGASAGAAGAGGTTDTAGPDTDTVPEPGTDTVTESGTASGPGSAADGAADDGRGDLPDVVATDRTVAGIGAAAAEAFLTALRSVAAQHQVVLLPYGDADIVALVRANMGAQARSAILSGREIGARILVQGPDATKIMTNVVIRTAVPPAGALTPQAWRLWTDLGVDHVLLAGGAVRIDQAESGATRASGVLHLTERTDGPAEGTAEGTTDNSADNTASTALIVGGTRAGEFTDILAGSPVDDSAATLSATVAEMALAPAASRAPVVVLPERRFTPRPQGLANLAELVGVLGESGSLAPQRLGDIVETAPSGAATLSYPRAALKEELPVGLMRRLADIRHRIELAGRALGQGPGGPDPAVLLAWLTDALVPATSAAWRGVPAPDAPVLAAVERTLGNLFTEVGITRDAGSHLLASSTAPLILTVHNNLPYQVQVSVRILGGQQAGLTARDAGLVAIGPGPRSMPVKLETAVNRSGTFTVYAQLTGPQGVAWGDPQPLTIDSRAYGALTIILMIAAAGVLLLMVAWRIVQRLRGGDVDPENAPVAAEVPAGEQL